MELQDEIIQYLTKYGIAKSHMAKVVGVYQSQLSSWLNRRLVLPDYHVINIKKYLQTLKGVDGYLQENNLAL